MPTTWDQLVAAAAKLQAAGIQPFAASGIQGWPITRLIGNYLFSKLGGDAMTKVDSREGQADRSAVRRGGAGGRRPRREGLLRQGRRVARLRPGGGSLPAGQGRDVLHGQLDPRLTSTTRRQNQIGLSERRLLPVPACRRRQGSGDADPDERRAADLDQPEEARRPANELWLKYIAQHYGDVAMRQKGQVTGFKVHKLPANLSPATKLVVKQLATAKNPVLWFEALFSAKATTVSQQDAAPLVTGQMSAQQFMAAVQTGDLRLAGTLQAALGTRWQRRRVQRRLARRPRVEAARWTQSSETDARSWSSSGPALLVYTLVLLAPIVWSLVYTFFSGNALTGFKYVGLANFRTLIHDPRSGQRSKFTLKYGVVVTVLQVGFGLLLSLMYVFYLRRGSALVRTLVFFPVVLPTVAVAQLFAKLFAIAPQYGLVNSGLHAAQLDGRDPGLARTRQQRVLGARHHGRLALDGLLRRAPVRRPRRRSRGDARVGPPRRRLRLPARPPRRAAAARPGAVLGADLQHQRHAEGVRLGRRAHQRRARAGDDAADALHVQQRLLVRRIRLRERDRDGARADLPADHARGLRLRAEGRDGVSRRSSVQQRPFAPAVAVRGAALRQRAWRAFMALRVALLLVVEVLPIVWLVLQSFKTEQRVLARTRSGRSRTASTAQLDGRVDDRAHRHLLQEQRPRDLPFAVPHDRPRARGAAFALEVMRWRGRNAVLLLFLAGILIPLQMVLLPLFTIYFHAAPDQLALVADHHLHRVRACRSTVFLMASYFRAVPREILEAATLDGASIYSAFFRVAVPMVSNAILTVALVQFFFIWNDLLLSLTFISDDNKRTIQTGLLNFTGQYGQVALGPDFRRGQHDRAADARAYLILNQRVMQRPHRPGAQG